MDMTTHHPATDSRRRDSRGSVSAETAVALPSLLVVTAAAIWPLLALSAQLRCADAARSAARALARGERADVVVHRAGHAGTVRTSRSGPDVTVTVSTRARAPGYLGRLLPPLQVTGRAVARVEPAAVGSAGEGGP